MKMILMRRTEINVQYLNGPWNLYLYDKTKQNHFLNVKTRDLKVYGEFTRLTHTHTHTEGSWFESVVQILSCMKCFNRCSEMIIF